MSIDNGVSVVRGEHALFERTAHLFAAASEEVVCAAESAYTWVVRNHPHRHTTSDPRPGLRLRKVYRPAVLLDDEFTAHLREVAGRGAGVRISRTPVNETIILDRRVAIVAGGTEHGERGYSVVSQPDLVAGLYSLFEATWQAATPLADHDRSWAELRELAPRIVDVLSSGAKDEAAARGLGLSVRTYRRRVAELMDALGAESRFQAGVRARELGLV